ncbi:MAG TPA: ATP-binding protein [Anaeromyxobacter sp.]
MPFFPRTTRGRLLAMALLALVPLLAMAVRVVRSSERVRDATEIEANLELARAAAAAFSGFVADVQRTAHLLGATLASDRSAEKAAPLLAMVARTSDVFGWSWASVDGAVVRSTDPVMAGAHVTDRACFRRILAGADVAVSDLLEGSRGFVVAVAVRDPGRRLAGVLLARVNPARLSARALPRRWGKGGYALVDPAGRVAVRTPALELPVEELEVASRQPFVRRALDGHEAAGTFIDEDGSEQLGAAVPIPGTGWAARASRDAGEVRAPVRRELVGAGVVALLWAAGWLGAAAVLGGRVSGDLALLEAHSGAMGRGERVPPPRLRVPELERLAERYGRMAERLRASREAFATVLDAVPAGIIVLDGATLRVRWANRAFVGYLEEPWRTRGVVGARVEEFARLPRSSAILERLRRVAIGELSSVDSEDRYDGLARGVTWWRWSLRSIPSAERSGSRDLLVLATEVTDQVVARRQIEDERRRLETVLRTLPVGVVIADATGAIVDSNEAAHAILGGPSRGVTPDALGRVPAWSAASGAPLETADWPLARALARGERVVGEMIDVVLGDHRRSLLVSATPVVDFAGDVGGAVAAFEDATEMRRAVRRERLLHEAGAASAETLDFDEVGRRLATFAVPQIGDCCCVDEVLPDGTLAEVAAIRGPAGETCSGATTVRVLLAWRAVATRATAHVLAAEGDSDELACALADAGLLSAAAVPLVAGGRVFGVLTLATGKTRPPLDAEDLRATEELGRIAAQALANARLFAEVRRAVEARDEVLSIVSHDLRTPLGTVTLGARVLADLPDGPDALDRVRATGARIQRAGERMGRLIADLLDLASFRAGHLDLRRAACAPADLVREAADDVRGPARARGLDVKVEVGPGLPLVACDRGRVLQVLGNLASNAVKATERGEVRLAAEAGDGEVVFSVSDTGPGIPEEEQPGIFERFRRGAGARYAGAGLGLSIARALVEAHGGRIQVESRAGEGTTMRFTIPCEAALARTPSFAGQGPTGTSAGATAAGL